MNKNKAGFSLVELSIVLVILGLLVGGVLSGRSLIRAAEMRSIITDYHRYTAAVYQFQEKYRAFPGDMRNATEFWGVAGGNGTGRDAPCYAIDSTTLANPKATCNGNGNGRLMFNDNVADGSAPEWYRAWQHLSNAGLVEGRYTGTADNSPRGATVNKNVPESKLSGNGFTLMSYSVTTSTASWWAGEYDGFSFGSSGGVYENGSGAGNMSPEEAWSIDSKLDDGKPGRGLIRTRTGGSACFVSQDAYNLSVSGNLCGLFLALKDPGE